MKTPLRFLCLCNHLKRFGWLEELVSAHCYDEIVRKKTGQVSEVVFEIIFPSIKKALEEGDGDIRREILINWLKSYLYCFSLL